MPHQATFINNRSFFILPTKNNQHTVLRIPHVHAILILIMSNPAINQTFTRCRFATALVCLSAAIWWLGSSALRIATEGVGVLGVNNHVPWGWDIVLFVFWIGLGHAGTLISAILLLTGKRWRRSLARPAELMTICAVCTAGIFPLIHVGRAWMLWQLAPIPTASGVWPEGASALLWDAAAISSYLLLSCIFCAICIRGERADQHQHRTLWAHSCLLLAAILTPLVISVHSIVGSDFALTLRWQSVIIPPYFVCGAILSGMAAVQLIALCKKCRIGTLGKMATLTAALSGTMGIFYAYELLTEPHFFNGSYAVMLLLNVILPFTLFSFRKFRHNRFIMAIISIGILIGMWQERIHIIIERSLMQCGGSYSPTNVDISMLLGSMALFAALFLFLSSRIPAETTDPRDHLHHPAPLSPYRAATIGCILALLCVCIWLISTQWADTAGTLGSSPQGFAYYIPLCLVLALLGAGLGVTLNYLHATRKP